MRFPFLLIAMGIGLTSCAQTSHKKKPKNEAIMDKTEITDSAYKKVTLGAGCFWCIEAVYQEIQGVISVESGYTGGKVPNPTYKEVCSGLTGHAEVAQITYDPALVSFLEILEIFWVSHDPTQLNRQGNDVGTQYRSVIYYSNEEEKRLAEESKKALDEAKLYPAPIVTEIAPLQTYYPAEDYHQNYFTNNPNQPYCSFVVRPKVEKVRKIFKEKLKPSDK